MTPPRQTDANIPRFAYTGAVPAPSPLAMWLKKNGIPFHSQRLKKKKTGNSNSEAKSVTASNVTTQELTEHLKWLFQLDAASVGGDEGISCRKVLDSIQTLFEEATPEDRKIAFSLPSEWLEKPAKTNVASSDNERFWRETLLKFLNIHDREHKHIAFRPQKDIEATRFPDSNIFNMHNEKLEGGGIASHLTNLLAGPIFTRHPGARSEMDVERVHGSPLSGFFNVPECETTSNVSVPFKMELTCFGSEPKPDFMTRIKAGVELERPLHHDLYPVIVLGEGKRGIKGSAYLQVETVEEARFPRSLPETGEKLPMVAQLAFSAYPSLVVIIASLLAQWKAEQLAKKKGPKHKADYQIPEETIIYGIGYASNGFLIYAFFPYIKSWDKNNFPSEWGFMSVLASNAFLNVFENYNVQARFEVARILSMVQQHARRLKDKIKSVKEWPVEFLAV